VYFNLDALQGGGCWRSRLRRILRYRVDIWEALILGIPFMIVFRAGSGRGFMAGGRFK
jgi:hypothetical protein